MSDLPEVFKDAGWPGQAPVDEDLSHSAVSARFNHTMSCAALALTELPKLYGAADDMVQVPPRGGDDAVIAVLDRIEAALKEMGQQPPGPQDPPRPVPRIDYG